MIATDRESQICEIKHLIARYESQAALIAQGFLKAANPEYEILHLTESVRRLRNSLKFYDSGAL